MPWTALRFAAGVAVTAGVVAAADPALAQGRLDARYAVSLSGIPVGKGAWVIDISENQFTAAASGATAGLLRVPGTGNPLVPQACQRTTPIFDGRMRYNLQFAYKRMEQVKTEKGYEGPVVVCSVYFIPVAGYIPHRSTIKYLASQRDMEVWLAPIGSTRVLVPYRISMPTPIGMGVMQATQFVSVALPRAAAVGTKTQ